MEQENKEQKEQKKQEPIVLELDSNETLLLKQLITLGLQYIGQVVPVGQGKLAIMASLKLEDKINNLTKVSE